MNIFKLDWFIFLGVGIILGALFSYSPKPNLDVRTLTYRVDHALDIINDLKELGMNIQIKDATEYFQGGDVGGCGKEILLPNDIVVMGTILDTKTKQAYDILHQVLCDLKEARC